MQLPSLVCLINEQGRVIETNAAVSSWGAPEAHTALGKTPHQLVHSRCTSKNCVVHNRWNQLWGNLASGGSQSVDLDDPLLHRRLHVSAGRVNRVSGIRRASGDSYAIVRISDLGETGTGVRDAICEADAFADASRAVAAAVDRERQRIASELHDGVCQRLALMKLQVEGRIVAGSAAEGAPEDLAFLEGLMGELRATIREVRGVSSKASPFTAVAGELLCRLNSLCADFDRSTGASLGVTFATNIAAQDPPARLRDDSTKLAIFRIVQESLHNVIDHSDATSVTVSLTQKLGSPRDGLVRLSISDNGRGFNRDVRRNRDEPGGMGLFSMRQRAEDTGGVFRLSSLPGEGAEVEVCWPA